MLNLRGLKKKKSTPSHVIMKFQNFKVKESSEKLPERYKDIERNQNQKGTQITEQH